MRALVLGLLLVLACGPDVEITSATISDSNGGSAEDSAEGAGCDEPPEILAFFDATVRLEETASTLGGRTDAIRRELALAMSMPEDSLATEIATEISAFYLANVEGSAQLIVGTVRCTGSIAAAADNLAICEPDLVAPSPFECMGSCLVLSAADCPGNAQCRTTSESCPGRCDGPCELEAGASCEGACSGECDGGCGCTIDDDCEGQCEGMCTGECDLVESSCAGRCLGECREVAATCTQALICDEPGAYCTHDCESWARPTGASAGCTGLAAFAGAADMDCAPTRAIVLHATTAAADCQDFAPTIGLLADAAGELEALRVHMDSIRVTGDPFEPLFDAWIAEPDFPECAVPLLQDAVMKYTDAIASTGTNAMDVDALLDAIAQQ